MFDDSLQRWIERFLAYLGEQLDRTPNTLAAYRTDLQQFLRLWPHFTAHAPRPTHWREVTSSHLWAYLDHLRGQGLSPVSLNRKLVSLRVFFDYLVDAGQIPHNPAREVKLPTPSQEPTSPLTMAEAARLLAAAQQDASPLGLRDRAMLELLYATGMRVGELLALNVDDVDLEAGTVRCGDGFRRRVLPLSQPAREALAAYLAHGRPALVQGEDDEPALFLNVRGRRVSRQGVWARIKHYVEQAGITKPVSPQTLRNTYATHMLQMGASPELIRQRLGNASSGYIQSLGKMAAALPNGIVLDPVAQRLVTD